MTSRPLATLLVILALAGCAPAQSNSTPARTSTNISADSPPEEVARLLIAALESSHDGALAQFVASKRASRDIAEITQGRKEFEKIRGNSSALAIAGWKLKFATLKPSTAQVQSHSINGEEATVIIAGTGKDDQPKTLTAILIPRRWPVEGEGRA